MEKKLFLEIGVTIEPGAVSRLSGPGGEVVCIPFGGHAKGEPFNGDVCPGACDVQTVNLSGVRHMCARYRIAGKDADGQDCHVFVENNGWFQEPMTPGAGFRTVPTLWTDSALLAPILHRRTFVGEGVPGPDGLVIKLYEVL